ncbi:MAG: glycosyltransferase family 1 protein [Bacteroidales bacterium]|nr:glycosyltransferase family 1 protein [Bacteroidales bacterium]
MKIAVNTRLLIKDKLDGIGRFTCESFRRITQQHPEHDFYFLFDRPYNESFVFSPNVIPVVVGPPARHVLLYLFWFEISLPHALQKIKPDLFISPDGFLSLATRVPSMAVIHDLNFEYYPGDLPREVSWYYRHFFPRFARKAQRIATVSNYSKNDITRLYGISPDVIDVVYNGANEVFRPLDEPEKAAVREKYTGGAPYYIFIGALHPRKNLSSLFSAFDVFRHRHTSACKLMIVGSRMWWTRPIRDAYESMEHKNDVIFTGRLALEELHQVLASAHALTYVSYFEGFGIPVVEAFACHTPVIASNLTSLPEVAGEAALLVDPFSIEQIAGAMDRLFTDESLRRELIIKGDEQGKKFSWDKTAGRLWTSIETVLQDIQKNPL